MTYKGHVTNGTLVLDVPVEIPDGVAVTVDVHIDNSAESFDVSAYRMELYGPLIGSIRGPKDWAERHDDYLRDEYKS